MNYLKMIAKDCHSEAFEGRIQHILDRLLAFCEPKAIFLFGSLARNQAREGSDIDLALIFQSEEEVKLFRENYPKNRDWSWATDILVYTASDFAKRSQIGGAAYIIAREGRILFERNPE